MISKTILIGVVAIGFVVGSLTSGTVAFASISQCDNNLPQGINKGKPFLEIWTAICDLQDQIDDLGSSGGGLSTYLKSSALTIPVGPIDVDLEVKCDPGDKALWGTPRNDIPLTGALGTVKKPSIPNAVVDPDGWIWTFTPSPSGDSFTEVKLLCATTP